MQRDSITKQQGQGLLVSFAVLILVGAIATVAYTVVTSSKNAQKFESTKIPQADIDISDNELQLIAKGLATKYLEEKTGSHDEDIQALSNTLNNLKNNKHKAAKSTLTRLKEYKLRQAIDSLKVLALATTDKRDAAKLWVDIGNISNLESSQEAIDSYQKSTELDPDNINAWNRIGHLERANKNYRQAEVAYKNVTRLSESLSQTQALSFANFGLLNQSQKKYEAAIDSFTKALEINTKLDNESGIASNNENLASLYKTLNRYDLAKNHYIEAFKIYEKDKQTSKLIELHSALGSLYQSMQQTELALSEYEKALLLTQQTPNKRLSAGLYANMGILSQQSNEPDKADAYFNQALTLYLSLKQSRGAADQYSNLAILSRNKKQFEDSERLHLKAIELYQAGDAQQAITTQYTNLGFLYTAWNKQDTACTYWSKSLAGLTNEAQKLRRERIQSIVEKDCKIAPHSPE